MWRKADVYEQPWVIGEEEERRGRMPAGVESMVAATDGGCRVHGWGRERRLWLWLEDLVDLEEEKENWEGYFRPNF